jgi:F-type H+-transporting ATPase subunit delta
MNASTKVVKTYAKSLFQNLIGPNGRKKAGDTFAPSTITSGEQNGFSPDVFIIGEELLLVRAIIISSERLKAFFQNPTYPEQQKLEVIFEIFPGLTVTMKSFLKILAERGHVSLLPNVSEEYTELLLKFKNVTKVKLITASGLSPKFGPLLLKSLKKLTDADEIILNIGYDPKLLGGLVVEYNSMAIDASILKEFSLFFNEI